MEKAPLTGEPHRRVELGLRLAAARLEEAAAACEGLANGVDAEHRRLIRQLIFEVGTVHESWCKAKEIELRATRIRPG